MNLYDNFERYY